MKTSQLEARNVRSLRPRAVVKATFRWLWKHREAVLRIVIWVLSLLSKSNFDD